MKKLSIFILAVMFVAVTAGYAFAEIAYSRSADARILMKTYTFATTAQSTASTLTAKTNRILGWTVSGRLASCAGLYDTTSTTLVQAGTGVVTEIYCAAGAATTIMFPTPYDSWSNTLYVLTPSTDSAVTIYYE